MQSFIPPMKISVLSNCRIGMPEESRNLADVEFLFLERIREEMPQRMMRDVWNSRVRTSSLQRSSNLFVSPAVPIREQRLVGRRLLPELLSSKLHFFFDAGQGFPVQRNVLRLST